MKSRFFNRRGFSAVEMILTAGILSAAFMIFSRASGNVFRGQSLLTDAEEQRITSRAMNLLVNDLKEAYNADFPFTDPVKITFEVSNIDPATGLPVVRANVVWELEATSATHGTLFRTWNGDRQPILKDVRRPQSGGQPIFGPASGAPDVVAIHAVYDNKQGAPIILDRRVIIRRSQ